MLQTITKQIEIKYVNIKFFVNKIKRFKRHKANEYEIHDKMHKTDKKTRYKNLNFLIIVIETKRERFKKLIY